MAGVIATGVRYMFSSANQRAEIKKSSMYLIIGMVLVFAASTFVGFVINAAHEFGL